MASKRRPVSVLDLETDPFEYGKMIHPFCSGFYDGSTFTSFWSKECVEKLITYLHTLREPHIIYAHNGGRFDFFWFVRHLRPQMRIVNGRIIQAFLGIHELRDSFAIMPFALEKYNKTKIDYELFRPKIREKHRAEILRYLRDDCTDLHTLCSAFVEEFGSVLTIGSASMKELKKFHAFETGDSHYDADLRPKFYYGGRVQIFKPGITTGNITLLDVNSMYPRVMRDSLHPISSTFSLSKRISHQTAFVTFKGFSSGALPVRQKDGTLDFPHCRGTYHTTIHEFNAALECGTLSDVSILECFNFDSFTSFDNFINHFYHARLQAEKVNDKIRKLFYKFVMNSAYGKFAQNPDNYREYQLVAGDDLPSPFHFCKRKCSDPCRHKWTPDYSCKLDGTLQYQIWSKPVNEDFYLNVATGCSITGAARAQLLLGLSRVEEPLYCDTDSIICRGSYDLPTSDTELGAWKIEATGNRIAIAGKKLYALFDGSECIKKAHKGARLTGDEILKIARGECVASFNPVPAFKWDGSYSFTKRTIKKTA